MEPKRTSYRRPEGESSRLNDKGWAWMVCLGCHVSFMLSMGYFASLGVFYLEWKDYFYASATASSWLVSVPWLVLASGSPIIGVTAQRIGVRRLSVAGAVLNALGTMLGSFSKELWHLYLTGALSGFGAGIVVTSSFVMLTRYFKRRYAFANGIAMVGVNVGQMIFPPLIRLLVAHYGWRGAMFIIGAVQMNVAAACALFRPLEADPKGIASKKIVMDVLPEREQTTSEPSTDAHQNCPKPTKGHLCLECLTFLKPLANIRFTLVILSIIVYSMGWIATLTHAPARANEAGWSENQGAALLTIFAVISMITRGSHGWVVDRKYIGVFKLHLAMLLCAAVATFLNPVSDSFVFLVAFMVAIGLFLGITSPLFFVVMRKLVGEDGMASAVSWIVTSFSLANGTGSVIAGKLFDATGNYVATFLCIGALFATAFLLVGAAVALEKRQKLLQKHRLPHSQTSDGNEAGSAEQL